MERLGPYRLLGLLGQGAMGVVYRAEHWLSGEMVAVKAMTAPSRIYAGSLRREVRALSRVSHSSIVRILQSGDEAGMPWYAMELVTGTTLRRLIANAWTETQVTRPAPSDAPSPGFTFTPTSQQEWWTASLANTVIGLADDVVAPPPAESLPVSADALLFFAGSADASKSLPERRLAAASSVIIPLCDALTVLHAEGIVHRDLKPDNIIVRTDGTPVIVDFGLALQSRAGVGRASLDVDVGAAGTVSYMAPEQIRGETVDARADLYALGCILYEMLTGYPPFLGRSPSEVLRGHLSRKPRPLSVVVPELPTKVEELLARMLAKEARHRVGYADEVSAVLEDARAPAGTRHFPRPKPRCPYMYSSPLLGREKELTRLRELLSGSVGVAILLVHGPAGIGKTRFMGEVGKKLARRELAVVAENGLGGRDSAESSRRLGVGALAGFQRFFELLTDWCRERDSVTAMDALGPVWPFLAPYHPPLRAALGMDSDPLVEELPPSQAVIRVYRSLLFALSVIAHDKGLVVAIDDLQWADDMTIGFLSFVARAGSATQAQLLILGAYRTENASVALLELAEHPRVRAVGLGALEEEPLRNMMREMLAVDTLPTALDRHVLAESGGNPYFTTEYLRMAVSEGLLERNAAGGWRLAAANDDEADAALAALPRPTSVTALLHTRLERLDDAARAVLSVAAVIGRRCDSRLVARVAQLEADAFHDGVSALMRHEILIEDRPGVLRFTSDHFRGLAMAELAGDSERELHRLVAKAMQELFAKVLDEHLADLAYHWERAGNTRRAAECYLAAARSARDRFALSDAESLYEACLRLLPARDLEVLELRCELAKSVLLAGGQTAKAEAAFAAAGALAQELGLERERIRCTAGRAESLLALGRLAEAEPLYLAAVEQLRHCRDHLGEAISLGYLGAVYWLQGRVDEGIAAASQALTWLKDAGEWKAMMPIATNLASMYGGRGESGQARSILEGILRTARKIKDRRIEGLALLNLGVIAASESDVAAARWLWEQALAIHDQIGNRANWGETASNLAVLVERQGDVEHARRLYEEAIVAHREVGNRRFLGITFGNLGELEMRCGQPSRAEALFREAIATFRQIGEPVFLARTLISLAALERRLAMPAASQLQLLREAEELGKSQAHAGVLLECAVERGHAALARGESASSAIDYAQALTARRTEEMVPGADTENLAELRRAEHARSCGEILFRGERGGSIPGGTLPWLQHAAEAAVPSGG
ncbi:MAG: protein kinase [Candidatus Schekmanbacteria bacterium]|nr:protein kinase [Candidatus Schekmanbacteria bacterium]